MKFFFFLFLLSSPASIVYAALTWRDSVKGSRRSLVFQRKAVWKNYAGDQGKYRSWSFFKESSRVDPAQKKEPTANIFLWNLRIASKQLFCQTSVRDGPQILLLILGELMHFYYPWNLQKIYSFLIISGGTEVHWFV